MSKLTGFSIDVNYDPKELSAGFKYSLSLNYGYSEVILRIPCIKIKDGVAYLHTLNLEE